MRIRFDIAYDGTDFSGWARQPEHRTVQGTIEQSVERVVGGSCTLVVAGRTDAGVHASGQVAHCNLSSEQEQRLRTREVRGVKNDPVADLARRVNGVLGSDRDVTVTQTNTVNEDFDARFSALWRRYRYRLADARTGYDPLRRRDTALVRADLDIDRMNAAAYSLLGLHDFAAYCRSREEATTIRTLLGFQWTRTSEGFLNAEVTADAFCHSMVRSLVGACVAVGRGKLAPTDVMRIREGAVRTSDFTVMPACGLTLIEVGYPDESLFAERAMQTRARREGQKKP